MEKGGYGGIRKGTHFKVCFKVLGWLNFLKSHSSSKPEEEGKFSHQLPMSKALQYNPLWASSSIFISDQFPLPTCSYHHTSLPAQHRNSRVKTRKAKRQLRFSSDGRDHRNPNQDEAWGTSRPKDFPEALMKNSVTEEKSPRVTILRNLPGKRMKWLKLLREVTYRCLLSSSSSPIL